MKFWSAILSTFSNTIEELFRLFFTLMIAFAVFAWVARELLKQDPAIVQLAEMARGSMVLAGIVGLVLLMKDSLGDFAERDR